MKRMYLIAFGVLIFIAILGSIVGGIQSQSIPVGTETETTSLLDMSPEQLETLAFGRIYYTSRTLATFVLAITGFVWLILSIRKVKRQESDESMTWGVIQAIAAVILLIVCSCFLYNNYNPMVKSWVAPQTYLTTEGNIQ